MMIRMKVGLSGPAFYLEPGDERDFPQAEALRLIAADFAIPVPEQKIERAVAAPVKEKRRKGSKQ